MDLSLSVIICCLDFDLCFVLSVYYLWYTSMLALQVGYPFVNDLRMQSKVQSMVQSTVQSPGFTTTRIHMGFTQFTRSDAHDVMAMT